MTWETKVNVSKIFELRCKTTCYFGLGAIKKMEEISANLIKMNINKVVVITDKIVPEVTGAWNVIESAFKNYNIEWLIYDETLPNPTVEQIDKATKFAKDFNAGAVLGLGGGSPIDVAKSVSVLLEYPEKTAQELYEMNFIPEKAKPIVAINTTHGTGTEVNRFAVASIVEKGYKPAIAYECIYPLFSIDDPNLMLTLPQNQTRFTAIDAVNHVTEAATTLLASPYSIHLAKETIKLVAKYLPQAIVYPEDTTARYYLLFASTIAGIAFDNALLHLTHALEHPLSALKPDLAHGLGLAILLPAVIKHIYPACSEVLASIYKPIVPFLEGIPGEAEIAAAYIEKWLFDIGITQKLKDLGFNENDIEKLTDLAMNTPSLDTLLKMAPIPVTKKIIEQIYKDSMYAIQ